jgi:ubiquitin C-terminal hydrolase
MSYGPYNPSIPNIYKTSSTNFESRSQPLTYSSKPRTNSSMGRTSLAQQGEQIIKNESRTKIESMFKEENKLTKTSFASEPKKEIRSIDYRNLKGVVGFRNLGNTCYMNSILQCLVRLPNFRDAFQSITSACLNSSSKLRGKLALAFKSLIDEVRSTSNNGVVTPYEVKAQIGQFSRQFAGYEQQDSAEFLRCILEALNQDLNRNSSKKRYEEMTGSSKEDVNVVADRWWTYSLSRDNSLITDYFQGQFASIITCEKCGYGSVSCDCFWNINLPSPENSYRSPSLDDCLSLYFASSQLPQSYKCEKCKSSGVCSQKVSLFRFPRIMVFQLKRFQVSGVNKQRLNTEISFPEELSLNKYRHQANNSSPKYSLFGVSHHIGSLNFGHYISHCKDENTWYCFDDSRAYSIDLQSRSSTAYVLFYVAGV